MQQVQLLYYENTLLLCQSQIKERMTHWLAVRHCGYQLATEKEARYRPIFDPIRPPSNGSQRLVRGIDEAKLTSPGTWAVSLVAKTIGSVVRSRIQETCPKLQDLIEVR